MSDLFSLKHIYAVVAQAQYVRDDIKASMGLKRVLAMDHPYTMLKHMYNMKRAPNGHVTEANLGKDQSKNSLISRSHS